MTNRSSQTRQGIEMQKRRITLIVVVLMGLAALAVAVPTVFGSVGEVAGY